MNSFILASRDQTLGCLRLYGDSLVSRAQPRITLGKPRPIRTSSDVVYGICRGLPSASLQNAYEILLMIGCYFFFLDIIGSQKHIATYNFHSK